MGREEIGEAVGPFDETDGGRVEVVVPAEGDDFGGGGWAVEVEVEDGETTAGVFVDEAEGGAGDVGGEAEAGGEAFGEVSFAGAEATG